VLLETCGVAAAVAAAVAVVTMSAAGAPTVSAAVAGRTAPAMRIASLKHSGGFGVTPVARSAGAKNSVPPQPGELAGATRSMECTNLFTRVRFAVVWPWALAM